MFNPEISSSEIVCLMFDQRTQAVPIGPDQHKFFPAFTWGNLSLSQYGRVLLRVSCKASVDGRSFGSRHL